MKRSAPIPNLASEAAVITAVIEQLGRLGAERFVDAGCGHGGVVAAAAAALPRCEAVGIELDPAVAREASRRRSAEGLANLRIVEGDALEHPELGAADVVFAYLGAALHQRLAATLAARRGAAVLLTAKYPAIGFPVDEVLDAGGVPIYLYRPGMVHRRVLWDAAWSVSVAAQHGTQLTTRIAEVYDEGVLGARLEDDRGRSPHAVTAIVGAHRVAGGLRAAIDLVVDAGATAWREPVRLRLTIDGEPLDPAHELLAGGDAAGPREEVGPFLACASSTNLAAPPWRGDHHPLEIS